MNKLLLTLLIALGILVPALASAQLTVKQGGTGLTTVAAGNILYGATPTIRLGNSNNLQYSASQNLLKFLYGSSTVQSILGPLYIGTTTNGTTTIYGNASSTFKGGIIASTGGFTISTLTSCSGSSALTTDSSGNVICGAISGGSGFAWPFDPQSYGNSTTSVIGFLGGSNGIFANSSSTLNIFQSASSTEGKLFVTAGATSTNFAAASTSISTSLSAASTTLIGATLFLNATGTTLAILGSSTVNGTFNAHALTIPTLTSALLLNSSAGATGAYAGSNPCTAAASVAFSISASGVITCANAVPFEFTVNTGYNSTTTPIGFLGASNGLFANASSTLQVFQSASSTIGTLFSNVATSTNFAVLSYFQAPLFGSTASTQIASSSLSVNSYKIASSSVTIGDGTVAHNLFAVHSLGMTMASSSLAYIGAFGASGSTTIAVANPLHGSTMRSLACKSDVGTAWVAFGNGSATTTAVQCASTFAQSTITANNTWTGRQTVYMEVGHSASSPNMITITADVEDSN